MRLCLLWEVKIQVHACLDVAYKYGHVLSLALSEARFLKLGVMLIKTVTIKDFNLFLLIILNTSGLTNTPTIPTSLCPHT